MLAIVTMGLRERAPALYRELKSFEQGVAFARWRIKNLPRVMRHRFSPLNGCGTPDIVEELRREGIAIQPFQQVIQGGAPLLEEVSVHAHRLWEEARRRSERTDQPSGAVRGGYGRKDYKIPLLTPQLSLDDPFIRLAMDPRILIPVNRYLGMRSLLRAVELWWDRPTNSPAKETQLWHRDGDDLMNVKVFLYFTDVDLETGPFCFLPRTHPRGPRRSVAPERDAQGRTTDEQMARLLPPSEWRVCTAPAGTMIFCDTCGYHKGLKPTRNERLMLMMQYTSATPRYPRELQVLGQAEGELSSIQREALAPLLTPS